MKKTHPHSKLQHCGYKKVFKTNDSVFNTTTESRHLNNVNYLFSIIEYIACMSCELDQSDLFYNFLQS